MQQPRSEDASAGALSRWPHRDKLVHPLQEVRHRALRSLRFKIQNGLIPPDILASDPQILSHLLSWFDKDTDETSNAVALEVLSVISKHPAVAVQLLALGAHRALLALQARLPAHLVFIAESVLRDLYLPHRNSSASTGPPPSYTVPLEQKIEIEMLPQAATIPEFIQPPLRGAAAALQTQVQTRATAVTANVASISAKMSVVCQKRPSDHILALETFGLHTESTKLCLEDKQQLEELSLQLKHSDSDAVKEMAVLQVQTGVLADVPIQGIIADADIISVLLDTTRFNASLSSLSRHVAECLHTVVQKLKQAVIKEPADPSRCISIGPIAHELLVSSSDLLRHPNLLHVVVPLVTDVLPLTQSSEQLAAGSAQATAFSYSWEIALQNISHAIQLSMVNACTKAGVMVPDRWDTGALCLVLDIDIKLLLDLAICMLQSIPVDICKQIVPSTLRSILGGIYCHPLTSSLLPEATCALPIATHVLSPEVIHRLESLSCKNQMKSTLLQAVEQLCCTSNSIASSDTGTKLSELLQSSSSFPMLSSEELKIAVCRVNHFCGFILGCGSSTVGVQNAATHLIAALLMHPARAVRDMALIDLSCQPAQGMVQLAMHADVLGAIVTAGLMADQLQQPALNLLHQLVTFDSKHFAQAIMPWSAWLQPLTQCWPPVGPVTCSLLQLMQQSSKDTTWSRLQPHLLDLLSSSPDIRSQAATHVFNVLAGCVPLEAAQILQFSHDPFAGILSPVHFGKRVLAGNDHIIVAQLFDKEDVDNLVQAVCSSVVPASTIAQALFQLGQVACDVRFCQVLGAEKVLMSIAKHVKSGCLEGVDLLKPALECLVQILKHVSTASRWFLEDAEGRAMPLLRLAFHVSHSIRDMAAQILYHILIVPATARWLQLWQKYTASPYQFPQISPWSVIPHAFAGAYHFPSAIHVVALSEEDILADEEHNHSDMVSHLWESQQMMEAAATSSEGLEALLKEKKDQHNAWKQDFLLASSLTLKNLNLAFQINECLTQLQQSSNHRECWAAVARMRTVMCTKQGANLLATSSWFSSIKFLLDKAPMSNDDLELWIFLLPVMQQILSTRQTEIDVKIQLLTIFVGASGRAWLEQHVHEEGVLQAQLAKAIMQLCETILTESVFSPGTLRVVYESTMLHSWIQLLSGIVCKEQAPYSTRISCASLMARIADVGLQAKTLGHAAAPRDFEEALLFSMKPLIQQVLHPKAAWDPAHFHGKALVQKALQFVQKLVHLLPYDKWSTVWAGVGGTYWMSRLIKDQDANLRQGAFQLLKFLLSCDATFTMLGKGWPECGVTVCKVLANATEPPGVRAAALHVAIAAMSRQSPVSSDDPDVENITDQGLFLARTDKTPITLNAQFFLQEPTTWEIVLHICQDSASQPCLVSAAANALLQHVVLDAEKAWEMLAALPTFFSCVARPLMELMAQQQSVARLQACTTATGTPSVSCLPLSDTDLPDLIHAIAAVDAAAMVLANLLQTVPESASYVCNANNLQQLILCCRLAATVAVAVLPERLSPATVSWCQETAWSAHASLAHAAALSLLATESLQEDSCRHHMESALPLIVCSALALQLGGTSTMKASLSILQTTLSRPDWARIMLYDQDGNEHCMLESDGHRHLGGSSLCVSLVDIFVKSQQTPIDNVAQEEIMLALRGLLAYSHAAKGTAVQLGLHQSSLDTCNSLAAAISASLKKAKMRNSKLQSLKKQRTPKVHSKIHVGKSARLVSEQQPSFNQPSHRMTKARITSLIQPTDSEGQNALQVCEGGASNNYSKEPAQETSLQASSMNGDTQETVSSDGFEQHDNAQGAVQSLLSLLRILQAFTFQDEQASNALAAEGLATVCLGALWRVGKFYSQVMVEMFDLLINASSSSRMMRSCWTDADGKGDGLLACISLAVMGGTLPTPMHSKACTTLCCFVATPDGCTAALRTNFAVHALRAVQSFVADKDYGRLESLLQVLESLASQSAEGQRAVLRTAAPSGGLLDILLGLLQHPATAVAARAAAVLRNVALCPEAKTYFLARSGALGLLVDVIAQAPQQFIRAAHAAAALWGLVYQGEKVKAALRRCKGLDSALTAATSSCADIVARAAFTTPDQECEVENLVVAVEALTLLLR